MTVTNRLGQSILSAAVIGLLGIACSSGLKDYTQIDLKVLPTEVDASSAVSASETSGSKTSGSEASGSKTAEAAEDAIAQTLLDVESAVEKRLLSLGLETAEVTTQVPDQVIVRLPEEVTPERVVQEITQPNRLTLRSQKPDTEEELASNIETLQRLLVEQNNLKQTDNLAEADALQPQIDQTRGAILNLFEPGEITGEMLLDAQAVQMSGFNIWEVQIWFDSQGTDKFAEKTKALAGTGRAIGLFLDDVLLSAPTVDVSYSEEGITGGASTISGNFTAEAARELEQQLKNGALPSDLAVVSVTSSADQGDTAVPDAEEQSDAKEQPEAEEQPKAEDASDAEESSD